MPQPQPASPVTLDSRFVPPASPALPIAGEPAFPWLETSALREIAQRATRGLAGWAGARLPEGLALTPSPATTSRILLTSDRSVRVQSRPDSPAPSAELLTVARACREAAAAFARANARPTLEPAAPVGLPPAPGRVHHRNHGMPWGPDADALRAVVDAAAAALGGWWEANWGRGYCSVQAGVGPSGGCGRGAEVRGRVMIVCAPDGGSAKIGSVVGDEGARIAAALRSALGERSQEAA